jgi:uncharacterized membrane protein (UPF0182 family)
MRLWRTPRIRALLIVGTLGALAGLLWLGAGIYTDLLWFHEIGQDQVYWTTLGWKLLPPAVAGLGTACFVLANLALVERWTREAPGPARPALAKVWRYRRLLQPVVAAGCGLIAIQTLPDDAWRLLLLWANRSDFGTEDPVFHRDAGFFVFSLPLHALVVGWLLATIVMAGGAAGTAYALGGAPRAARGHALGLAALLLLVAAWRVRLDQLQLVLPHHDGVLTGASHSEVAVRLPALGVFVALLVSGALLCAAAAVRRAPLAPLAVLAAVAGVVAAGSGGLQDLVERVDVAPQRLSRERHHLEAGIAATQRAYALDGVDVRSLPGDRRLSARTVAANRGTLENVPLWDTRVLRPAMEELQSIGGYYGFPSATVDRYTLDGVPRLLTIAARQLQIGRLRREARTWTNERFAYTHGYGVVAVPGGSADAEHYPRFSQGEFRSRGNALRLKQPRIYFGQDSRTDPPYLVLNSARGEVEQPVPGSRPPAYRYNGPGGIPLSSLLRRAAFALRFGDLKLFLTKSVTAHSRIVVRRDVRMRVRTLAPFLRWDAHPQTVVAGGRVHFLLHGYTTSSHYPYAARLPLGTGDVNYMRAPALAAVDAFSGRVTLYAAGGDPILLAWQAAYPGLFRPMAELPPPLRAHLRYPRMLFEAQTAVYATYHAEHATGFWNGADAWQPSRQLAGPVEDAGEIHFPDSRERLDTDERRERRATSDRWRAQPGYLLARLPGDRRERFMLTATFTPRGRQNLVAYLAGSVGRDGEPRLTLLSLPRDRLTIGPTQATREVLASPGVNRRIQVLNRESRDLGRNSINRTVLGTPRVVPLGEALLHIQPLYITAGGSGLPRLQLVTAYANGRVGFGRDLEAAVTSLLREPACGPEGAALGTAPAAGGAPRTGCPSPPPRTPPRRTTG